MKGIQKIEAEREARRANMQKMKEAKEERKMANLAAGKVNDVDYDLLID